MSRLQFVLKSYEWLVHSANSVKDDAYYNYQFWSQNSAGTDSGWGHICLVAHNTTELYVGDINVAPASTARNLGVLFDRNLKFDAQITKTCWTGYLTLDS